MLRLDFTITTCAIYSPTIGRYVEADPIGIRRGKNHLYQYVAGNPIISSDPSGFICVRSSGQQYIGAGALRHHWPLNRFYPQGPQNFNLIYFDLPCGSCYKPTNLRIEVDVPEIPAELVGVNYFSVSEFSIQFKTLNCGETGRVSVSIGTRVAVLTDMIDYYVSNMEICYDCEKCR